MLYQVPDPLTSRPLPPLYSPWTIPVPAEVICRSPRFNVSTLPIESECLPKEEVSIRVFGFYGPYLCSLDGSIDNVGENLKLAVGMRRESLQGRDTILIDDPQRSPTLFSFDGRIVRGETESLQSPRLESGERTKHDKDCHRLTWNDLSQPWLA